MMEKKTRDILMILSIGMIFLLSAFLVSFEFNKSLDDVSTCKLCHEMVPYVNSYLKRVEGSVISKHDLKCIECHSNNSLREAKEAILKEIGLSVLSKAANSNIRVRFSALAVNCTKCHIMDDFKHFNTTNNTQCFDCHWSHMPLELKKIINEPIIPYGPHINQTCENCHGKTFEIPRCMKCHKGHGEQDLENRLCLGCHIDPHIPKKPGILFNNTFKFSTDLPLSVCQPCHEKEYLELINSGSLHFEMQTCVRCHKSHGDIPRCEYCHRAMQVKPHLSIGCGECHLPPDGRATVPCMNCHGRSHDWSKLTVTWGSNE